MQASSSWLRFNEEGRRARQDSEASFIARFVAKLIHVRFHPKANGNNNLKKGAGNIWLRLGLEDSRAEAENSFPSICKVE